MNFDFLLITKLIAAMVLPPGGIITALVLAWLLRRRSRALAWLLAVIATAALGAFSLPVVSGLLMAGLEDIPVLKLDDPRLARAQAIVVLGGGRRSYAPEYQGETVSGTTLERIRYGARLQRATGLPLAVSGGLVFPPGEPEALLMARALREDFQVPVRWTELRSRTTFENGQMTRALLEAEGVDRIVLVTHVSHMHRALEVFENTGFEVTPAPTVYRVTPDDVTVLMDWVPSANAFGLSTAALHEYLGRVWYGLKRLI